MTTGNIGSPVPPGRATIVALVTMMVGVASAFVGPQQPALKQTGTGSPLGPSFPFAAPSASRPPDAASRIVGGSNTGRWWPRSHNGPSWVSGSKLFSFGGGPGSFGGGPVGGGPGGMGGGMGPSPDPYLQDAASNEPASPIPWWALTPTEMYLFDCPGHPLDGEFVSIRRGTGKDINNVYVRAPGGQSGGKGKWTAARASSKFYATPPGFTFRGGIDANWTEDVEFGDQQSGSVGGFPDPGGPAMSKEDSGSPSGGRPFAESPSSGGSGGFGNPFSGFKNPFSSSSSSDSSTSTAAENDAFLDELSSLEEQIRGLETEWSGAPPNSTDSSSSFDRPPVDRINTGQTRPFTDPGSRDPRREVTGVPPGYPKFKQDSASVQAAAVEFQRIKEEKARIEELSRQLSQAEDRARSREEKMEAQEYIAAADEEIMRLRDEKERIEEELGRRLSRDEADRFHRDRGRVGRGGQRGGRRGGQRDQEGRRGRKQATTGGDPGPPIHWSSLDPEKWYLFRCPGHKLDGEVVMHQRTSDTIYVRAGRDESWERTDDTKAKFYAKPEDWDERGADEYFAEDEAAFESFPRGGEGMPSDRRMLPGEQVDRRPIPHAALEQDRRYYLRSPGDNLDATMIEFRRGSDGRPYIRAAVEAGSGRAAGQYKRVRNSARFYDERIAFFDVGDEDEYGGQGYDYGAAMSGRSGRRGPPPSGYGRGYGGGGGGYGGDIRGGRGAAAEPYDYGAAMSGGRRGGGPAAPFDGPAGERPGPPTMNDGSVPKPDLVENGRYLFRSPGHELDGALVTYSRRGNDGYHYVREGSMGRWKRAAANARFYPAEPYDRRGGLPGFVDQYERRGGVGGGVGGRQGPRGFQQLPLGFGSEYDPRSSGGQQGGARGYPQGPGPQVQGYDYGAAMSGRGPSGYGQGYGYERQQPGYGYDYERAMASPYDRRVEGGGLGSPSFAFGAGRSLPGGAMGSPQQQQGWNLDRRFYERPSPHGALKENQWYLFRSPGDALDGSVVMYRRGSDGSPLVRARENEQWRSARSSAEFYPERGSGSGGARAAGVRPTPGSALSNQIERSGSSSFAYGTGRATGSLPSYAGGGGVGRGGVYGKRMRPPPPYYEGDRRGFDQFNQGAFNQGFVGGDGGRPIPNAALVEGEFYLFRSPGHDLDGAVVMYRRGSDGSHYVKVDRAGGSWKRAGASARFYPARGGRGGFGNERYDPRQPGYGYNYGGGDRRALPPYDRQVEGGRSPSFAFGTGGRSGQPSYGGYGERMPPPYYEDDRRMMGGMMRPNQGYYGERPMPMNALVPSAPGIFGRGMMNERAPYYGEDRMMPNRGFGGGFGDRSIPKNALIEGEWYLFQSPGHELDGAIVMYRRGSDRYHYVRRGQNGPWKRVPGNSKFYPAQGPPPGFGNELDRRRPPGLGIGYDRRPPGLGIGYGDRRPGFGGGRNPGFF